MAVIDALDKVIKEELSPGIRESLPDIDDVFKEIVTTSMGVERDGLGRDWKFIHTFETGLSGAYAVRSAAGSSIVSSLDNVNMFDAPQGFPTYTEATATSFLQKTITLKEGFGNIAIPHQYLRADQLTASIGSAVKAILRGTAKKVAHLHAVNFYADDVTNVSIGDVGDISATGTNNGTTAVTVDFSGTDASGKVNRFFPGLLVDIYDSTGTTHRNSAFLVVVDQVDPLGNTVVFKSVNGSSTISFDDDDFVTFKDSKGQGFSGLNSWIKASGSVFGINLATYPQFKSLIQAIGGNLTEQVLNANMANFHDSYGGKYFLDTIITTAGVTTTLINDLDSDVNRFARQGKTLSVQGGWDEVGYSYKGRPCRWLISSYVNGRTAAGGDLYAIKTAEQNIQRFVPPALPGSASEGMFDGSVEFVAPLGGFSGIFMQSRLASGAASDGIEAPFVCVQEWCASNVQSMKLTGLTETYS